MRRSPELKAKCVAKFKEAKERGTPTIAALAKQLNISVGQLYAWVAEAKSGATTKRKRFVPIEIKRQAVQLARSGMKQADVARQLSVKRGLISYWLKNGVGDGTPAAPALPVVITPQPAAARVQPLKSVNGIGAGGELTDALIYLRHCEKELIAMIREHKVDHIDEPNLLALLALCQLQKSINK